MCKGASWDRNCLVLDLFLATAHTRGITSSRGNRKTGRAEVSNLLPDQFLQSHAVKLLVLKAKVEGATRYGFVGWIMEGFKEGVLQGILHGDSLNGVDLQHLAHDVQSFQRCSRELQRKMHGCLVGKFLHETFGLLGGNKIQIAVWKFSELLCDNRELEKVDEKKQSISVLISSLE